MVDKLLDREPQQLVLSCEEVAHRPGGKSGFARDTPHRGAADALANDDPPDGLGQIRSALVVVHAYRHGTVVALTY